MTVPAGNVADENIPVTLPATSISNPCNIIPPLPHKVSATLISGGFSFMSSQKRIDASRKNGALGGPKPPKGKAVSSRNACKPPYRVLSTEDHGTLDQIYGPSAMSGSPSPTPKPSSSKN